MTDVTLLHGDCLELMPTLPAQSVQMVFADLPYATPKHRHTRNKWDQPFDLAAFWQCANMITCDRAQTIVTASQPFTTILINSNIQQFSYCLVWNKLFSGSYSQAKHMPMRVHEDLVLFRKKIGTYNPQMILRDKPIYAGANKCLSKSAPIAIANAGAYRRKKYTHKFPVSILNVSSRADKRGLHPTQKPVALLEWLIKTYTNPGDTVLDPVAGSFTTAIACLRTGRKCIAIEKDADYFALGKARIEAEPTPLIASL